MKQLLDAGTMTDADLIAGCDEEHIAICGFELRRLLRWAEIDRRQLFTEDGCRDMASWISARYSMSKWEAHRRVAAGRALKELPLTTEALATGLLTLAQVIELTRFAIPGTEKKLIAWARRVSPAAVRRRADRACRPDPEDAKEAVRSRFLRWSFSDHSMWLEGLFPATEGAAIAKALARLGDQIPDLPHEDMCGDMHGAWCDDGRDARRADALYMMASNHIASDADQDRATVVVHTVLPRPGCDGWSEIHNGPVLAPDVGRELSCDARLRFVVTDQEGNALGIGRTSRDIPMWLEHQVRFRDGSCCTFPGCGRTTFLKSHHIRHWEDGGPTDLGNLASVCHFHHQLIHRFGWRVFLNGSVAEWFRPNGTRCAPGPSPPEQLSITDAEMESLLQPC